MYQPVRSRITALSFFILAGTVLLLVGWAGGIVPAAVCIAAVLTCGLAALQTLRQRAPDPHSATVSPFPWLETLCLMVLAFVALTLVPLPPAADVLAGAIRRTQHESVRQALRDLARAGLPADPAPWFTLSQNRAGTGRALLLLAAVFGAGALASRLTRRGRLAWLGLLVALGTAVAIAGYLGQWWIPQGDTLWWLFPIPHVLPGPVGGFINRNHFAGFLAMLVPVALGLAAWAWTARRRTVSLAAATGALAMGFALLMSLSRGAVLALAAGLAGTVLAALWRQQARAVLLVLTVGILFAAGLVFFPSDAVQTRIRTLRHPGEDSSIHTRLAEWRESLRVWAHYPVIGAGANALRMVYPQYRQTASGKWLVHAENMPIELLAEGGVVGVALLALLTGAIIRRARSSPAALPFVCRLGILGAILTVGAHALWDFAVLVPAYAVVLATLVGLLLPPSPPDRGVRHTLRLAPALAGLLAVSWLALVGITNVRQMDDPEAIPMASIPELQRALVWAPTSWHAWYYLGVDVARDGVEHANPQRCRLGARLASQAVRCDPQNYRLWYQLGELRLELLDADGADYAFQRAQALRPWLSPPPVNRPKGPP